MRTASVNLIVAEDSIFCRSVPEQTLYAALSLPDMLRIGYIFANSEDRSPTRNGQYDITLTGDQDPQARVDAIREWLDTSLQSKTEITADSISELAYRLAEAGVSDDNKGIIGVKPTLTILAVALADHILSRSKLSHGENVRSLLWYGATRFGGYTNLPETECVCTIMDLARQAGIRTVEALGELYYQQSLVVPERVL